MKNTFFQNWTIIRILRLFIGVGIIVQSVILQEILLGAAGLLFTGMALFNAGCCATSSCVAPISRKIIKSVEETSIKEVV